MLAAIYGRVSGVDDQRDGSLETQTEIATQHAVSLGFATNPDDVYLDRFTGAELYDRPALSTLRAKIRAGHYQAVVVRFLDRLSREPAHLAILFDECERHGCKIISATEEIDNTPIGELIRNIRGFAAKMERIRIKERTHEETRKIIASGKPPCSGVARFGYTYDKSTRSRLINEDEATVVRRIFQLSIDGYSIRRICLVLNSEGVPSPGALRGRKFADGRKCTWSKSTILAILQDTSYYGAPMSWSKTKNTGKRKKNGRAEVEKVAPDSWTTLAEPTPIIINRATWDRANGVKDTRKKDNAARSRNGTTWRMLRGMVFCATCGRTMTVQTIAKWTKSKGRYEFYRCMSNHRVGELPDLPKSGCGNGRTHVHHADAETWRQVSVLLKDRESIRQQIEASSRPDPSLDADIKAHEAVIAKAETVIKRLVDRLGDEDDDVVSNAMMEKIGVQKKVIAGHRKALEELQSRVANRERVNEAIAAIESILAVPNLNARVLAATGKSPEEPLAFSMIYQDASGEWVDGGEQTDTGTALTVQLDALRGGITDQQKREILEALGVKVYLSRTEVRVECNLPLVTQIGSAEGREPSHQRLTFILRGVPA